VALLLLRIAAAVTVGGFCYYAIQSSLNRLAVFALAVATFLLFLGLGTRIVALLCAVIASGVALTAGLTVGDWRGAIVAIEVLNLIAIGLLGAGAYSVDAHLFGRRVIRLDG